MMRTTLVALVAARFFQAPSPATVPVNAPIASNAGPYMAPVSYGFEQAAFPSAPVAVPVATPRASSSKALPLMAGAALGATVAVLFSSGGGKKAAAKKPAAKKPAAKKPVAKAAAKPAPKKAAPKPAPKKAPVAAKRPSAPVKTRSTDPNFKSPVGKGGLFPWIVNKPGTYAKPLMLSSILSIEQTDKLIGWGAMPDSVKNLYNPNGRKGLLGGSITPAKGTRK